jgi:hypothetical protein
MQYNVGLCSLQSDIGSSDIQVSPISLITNIGLSATYGGKEEYVVDWKVEGKVEYHMIDLQWTTMTEIRDTVDN